MVLKEDALFSHLVIDASGFIKRAPIRNMGKVLYTINEIITEIIDKPTREYLKNSSFELVIKNPSLESLKIVTEISKKTGDYPSMSLTDLKLIALVHDLQVEHCGKSTINYNISTNIKENFTKSKKSTLKKEKNVLISEIETKNCNSTDNIALKLKNKDDLLNNDANKNNETDFFVWNNNDETDWITQDNFDEALLKYNSKVSGVENQENDNLKSQIEVACLTTDFSIQNVLMHMKLNILSLDGLIIKKLKSYILRCRSCFTTTSKMEKNFCSHCGYPTLDQVAVSVDNDGVMQLHIDFERLRVTRGFKHSIKAPKGGKHNIPEKIFEDQRIPHNRMAKIKQLNLDSSPFLLNDVNSRSARLGIRSIINYGKNLHNPNESKGGKRKKR